MDLCNIRDIKALLSRHGFSFSKGLGQNFLCDPSVPYDIAENAFIDEGTCVLEVGPGIGALTRELCSRAKKVVAVELDKRLPDVLKETLQEFDNFTLLQGDILKTDIAALCAEHFAGEGKIIACANLPYYITTPAVAALIDSKCFSHITVMVQKEVAMRICAQPGTSDYGAFTPYIAYNSRAQIVLEVGKDSFVPVPKVDSAVVRLDTCPPPVSAADEKLLFAVIKGAFAQRRKTLINSMSASMGGFTKAQMEQAIAEAGVDAKARGETLGLEQFCAIANSLAAMREKNA